MAGYICPFCNHSIAISDNTFKRHLVDFGGVYATHNTSYLDLNKYKYLVSVSYYRCPNCGEDSVIVDGYGKNVKGVTRWINPISAAKAYPEYIPKQIRTDYEEASAIVDLSPKASATLARRCLQGMIRDFWGIYGKRSLSQEIEEITDKVSPSTKRALNDIRQIGNIGAHMEQDIDKIIDIDPGEAKTLLRLIEHLIKEWYITRHETEKLMEEISQINSEKQSERTD